MKMKNVFSGETNLITYTSFCGGSGTSTIAVCESIAKAKAGHKVLYLNLEYFDSTEIYFQPNEKNTFSNLVFMLKKNDINIVSKLEEQLSRDESGVYYLSPSTVLLDKLEILNCEDMKNLFNTLRKLSFDYIVIDRNISFSEEERLIYEFSDSLRFVVDGREVCNLKFLKLMNALDLLDKKENKQICNKIGVIYNKMSSSFNNVIKNKEIPILATVSKYKTNDEKRLVNEIVSMNAIRII